MIHQIYTGEKKLNETCGVLLTIDYWSSREMPSYIGVTVHFNSN